MPAKLNVADNAAMTTKLIASDGSMTPRCARCAAAQTIGGVDPSCVAAASDQPFVSAKGPSRIMLFAVPAGDALPRCIHAESGAPHNISISIDVAAIARSVCDGVGSGLQWSISIEYIVIPENARERRVS